MIARSSAKAEYRTMESTARELTWIKHLLHDLGIEYKKAMKMYCDNQATRHIIFNPVFHECTKHIEVDCHFIRENVQFGEIMTPFIRNSKQLTAHIHKSTR
jgi:hypothetical protein